MVRQIWTFQECLLCARQYPTRGAWRQAFPSAYQAAYRNGWLERCCAHMPYVRLPPNTWTLEMLKADALRFSSRLEWSRNSRKAYSIAQYRGVIDECCGHMQPPHSSKRKSPTTAI